MRYRSTCAGVLSWVSLGFSSPCLSGPFRDGHEAVSPIDNNTIIQFINWSAHLKDLLQSFQVLVVHLVLKSHHGLFPPLSVGLKENKLMYLMPCLVITPTDGWRTRGPVLQSPIKSNPGLRWNFRASLFLNMRRILYQNAWITKLNTRRTVLVLLRLKSCLELDQKSRWRIHSQIRLISLIELWNPAPTRLDFAPGRII